MLKARIFRDNDFAIVTADEVKVSGIDYRNTEFVDCEEEFKVTFVKAAKCGGRPYFRLYYSLEDYKKLNVPEKMKTRYEIISKLRHWQNGPWHNHWQEEFSRFCEIEKTIKNEKTGKYRFADAYYEKYNTCIELQHSFIDREFEERNKFYKELGIRTVWLYDLPKTNVVQKEDGSYEILEDNARGFFKIALNMDNLKNNYVFIQTKDGLIYRVSELFRRVTLSGLEIQSTIRYFYPLAKYTPDDFVTRIINDDNELYEVYKDYKTITGHWEKGKTKVAIFYNVENGWYAKVKSDPWKQIEEKGRIEGFICKDRYFKEDVKLAEIFYWHKKVWELIWKCDEV